MMPELFANFEVNRDPRRNVIVRLLGGSAVLHLALAATVMYVPTFRDAFSVAVLLGKSTYVDKPYAKTAFGENIQIVQVGSKFQYPEGYFAVGLPQAAVSPTPNLMAPKIISQSKPLKTESTPSPSPSPVSSPSPLIAQAQGSAGQPGGSKNGDPAADKKTIDDQTNAADKAKQEQAQKGLDAIAAANHVELPSEDEINRQPLKDLVADANREKNEGKLDIDRSFEVRIEGDLDANGRLTHPPMVTRKSGDAALVDLSQRAFGVLNESGLLAFLKILSDGQPIKIALAINQDQDQLSATLESEVNNEDTARQKAGSLNGALVLGQIKRKGKDEEILMKNTNASAEGKKVIIKFKMSRQAVGELLKKQLAANSTTKQG